MAGWHIKGRYMETCNCEFICPCIGTNLTATPSEGDCKAAIAMQIDEGEKDGVKLDGLSFIVLLYAPGPMIDGNIKVGLIIDDKADDKQTEAIAAIASGAEGGPMGALAPLVGEMAGVEKAPVRIAFDGMNASASAGSMLDQAIEGVPSHSVEGEPIYLENVAHPVNTKLALATASKSHFNAFGITWDDTTGTRNGHYAPFSWAA